MLRFVRHIVIVISTWSGLALAVDKPTTLTDSCVSAECHAVYGKKPHLHGPVELGDCKACHKPVDPAQHSFKLPMAVNDLCQSCHLEQGVKRNKHMPLTTGNCLQCHDPHSSENKSFLLKNTVAQQCAECHDTTQHKKFLHGPVAVGECTVCHNSHSSDYEKLLQIEPSKLCLSCHTLTAKELGQFEYVHEPVKGKCASCHNPHGADNPQLIKDSSSQMCLSCHEKIQTVAANSKVKHDMMSQEGGCLQCHTPHASTVKKLLKKDPETLCMSCHDKPVGISKTEVLPAFTRELMNKKYLHGPVAQRNCTGCHEAHGGNYFRLLIKNYPAEFYAPFAVETYDLCFSCHPKALSLVDRTQDLTDFRNGDQNLHYLHVNKDPRGRTCRACHQTHASNLPKHIRETVPFGSWELPVQFSKTDTGGSCLPGCHIAKGYDRKSPVDYAIPKESMTAQNDDRNSPIKN